MTEALHVELEPDSLRLEPGRSVAAAVRVVNLGEVVEEYELTVVGLPAGVGRVEPSRLSLLPEQEGQARVVLDLSSGSVPAGTRVAGIRVASRNDPSRAYVAELSLEVAAVDDLDLRVEPQTLRAGGTGHLRAGVHNQGNRPADVVLRGTDDEGAVSFTFEPQQLRVEPGVRAISDVTVSAPRAWTGAPRHRQLRFGAGEAEAHATFVQKARVSTGVLTAVGILLSLLVVGAIALCADGNCFGGDQGIVVDPAVDATDDASGSEDGQDVEGTDEEAEPDDGATQAAADDTTDEADDEGEEATDPAEGGADGIGEFGPIINIDPALPDLIGAIRACDVQPFVPCELSVLSAANDGAGVAVEEDAGYGRTVAAVDIDGDGRDELAVGVPGATVDGNAAGGYVVIVDSSEAGLRSGATVMVQFSDVTGAPPPTANDQFGAAFATGDFDGDGIEDLAVGVPGAAVDGNFSAGGAAVLYGGGDGVAPRATRWVQVTDKSVAFAGRALAAGNFDARGGDDLAVGVPQEAAAPAHPASGAVHVVSFRSDGAPGAQRRITQATLPGVAVETGDGFGAALTAGDLDDDGIDDLVVGVPGEAIGDTRRAGLVHVLRGVAGQGPDPESSLRYTQDTEGVPGVVEADDLFGQTLATGDVTGDGVDDLVVGAPGEAIGDEAAAGAVWVMPGGSDGPRTAETQLLDQNDAGISGGSEAGDRFGAALAVGDIDGDGVADLLVGAESESESGTADVGVVNGFRGGPGQLVDHDPFALQPGDGFPGAVTDGSRLGGSLVVGDFDDDAEFELVAGAPGVGIDGAANAGRVLVAYAVGGE